MAEQNISEAILSRAADEADVEKFAEEVRKQYVRSKQISSAQARAVVERAIHISERVEPATEAAKAKLGEAKETIKFYQRLLDANDVDIKALEMRVLAEPNDVEAFLLYEIKFQLVDDAQYEKESFAKANERLDHVASVIASTREKTTDGRIADECDILLERIDKVHKARIVRAQRRLELVGSKALLPLAEHGAWLNGDAPRVDELKGKVVLVDFWALWCGPCIEGFSKVAQWNHDYQDKDLVIIAAVQKEGDESAPLSQAEQIQALFQQQNLAFRCLIDEGSLFRAHRVDGVPQYTLIDRNGKIRVVRTGNNPASQNDIEAEIEKLLQESTE